MDSLTHLRNHRAFQTDLDRALAQAGRGAGAVTLVLIDLDNLKQVNDVLGHQHGDERLKALAEAARRAARSDDGAYRVGGDEFALILADTCAHGGRKIVQRLQAELAHLTGWRQTATAGIAELAAGIDRDQLIRNADVAMLEGQGETPRAVDLQLRARAGRTQPSSEEPRRRSRRTGGLRLAEASSLG